MPCASLHCLLLPQTLKSLIERCWHPNPEKRPNFVIIIDELTKLLDTMQRKVRTFPL